MRSVHFLAIVCYIFYIDLAEVVKEKEQKEQ